MPEDPAKLRNVAVVGHRGSGKTTLVEAMLYASGAINRMGSIADGNTVSDWDDEERRRGMSISASLCHASWEGVRVNLLDTPGEPSFHADTLGSLRAVDSALMVVNATAGVEVQTERLWERAAEYGLGRAVVISMLDRERADFPSCLAAVHDLDPGCIAVHLPIGSGEGLTGIVNLASMTATTYSGAPSGTPGPIPPDMMEAAEAAHTLLVETVCESDDELIERYLAGDEITAEEFIAGLHRVVRLGKLFPVMCAAPAIGVGADRVLNALVRTMPSPEEVGVRGAVDAEGKPIEVPLATDGPGVAFCFKTFADQFSGKINLLRVIGGTLPSDTHVVDHRNGNKERVGQLMQMQGKEHTNIHELGPGDIGAVAKLKEVATGDVLTTGESSLQVAPVDYPPPVMSFAITPRTAGDDDKLVASIRRLREEDPTLDLHRDEETGELIVGGVSQMHIESIMERMHRRFGVDADLHAPRVPYRETITIPAKAEGKHRKQSGGRGQFGDCWLRVEPLPAGSGIQFVDEVVGGAIPRGYISAVERGVMEAARQGTLGGFQVVDVRVTVYDGKHHAVDSSEMAFKIAGSLGMKAALEKAKPVLLEPIMQVVITVPDEHVGDVMGDLASRRGHPQGMEAFGHNEVVRAEVPMAEMLSYAIDLRAMTAGRGDYTMAFARYDPVPAHIAQRTMADAAVTAA